MTKILIAFEIACLALIGFLAEGAVTWPGSENWAAVGVLLYGGPALILQFIAMAIALIVIARSDAEPEDKTARRWWATIPAVIGALLFGYVVVTEMAG